MTTRLIAETIVLDTPPETTPLRLAEFLRGAAKRIKPDQDVTMIVFYRSELAVVIKALEYLGAPPLAAPKEPFPDAFRDYLLTHVGKIAQPSPSIELNPKSSAGQRPNVRPSSELPNGSGGHSGINEVLTSTSEDGFEDENGIRHTISQGPTVDHHGQVFAPSIREGREWGWAHSREVAAGQGVLPNGGLARSSVFQDPQPHSTMKVHAAAPAQVGQVGSFAIGLQQGQGPGLQGGGQQGGPIRGHWPQQGLHPKVEALARETLPWAAAEDEAIRQAALRGGYPPERPSSVSGSSKISCSPGFGSGGCSPSTDASTGSTGPEGSVRTGHTGEGE